MEKPIDRAIQAAGGVTQLARAIKVSPPTVSQWSNGDRPVPGGRCIAIEQATKGAVTRYDLRPDIFGKAPTKLKDAA